MADSDQVNGDSQHISSFSQTAQDYIASQLRLEADAREVLPYQFDSCTQPLGPLRQSVFACLTCTPPPASPHQHFTPAGVCYSCSISCHGDHNLVELFSKRDFVCDCGTTRLASCGTPCSLRHNAVTGRKGGVVGEEAREGNRYNHNFQGRFCGCGEEYDPEREKGTMFQCLGLGTMEEGGCGEDWWHAECLMGLPRQKSEGVSGKATMNGELEPVREEDEVEGAAAVQHEVEPPLPPGFPAEDDFDHLICYKCVDAFPWIKQYAATPGFLPAVPMQLNANDVVTDRSAESRKRKADDDVNEAQDTKKVKVNEEASSLESSVVDEANGNANKPRHTTLPSPPRGSISLFLKEDFRDHLCRCTDCFPRLARHRQLFEEEDSYEPPLSESSEGQAPASVTGRSVNSGSLLERGEAALSSMDRVRAIEGVMAYNHVRDKVKAFLQPFAESGQAVGAEDIKAYFAKLRGDEAGMKGKVVGEGGRESRKEQEGY
ncbi:hypothetical protein BAUCODRAFT_510329 [Baudoinia panamericana UAMH 10762]|uniref:UBR-type domain-containing protein n=1 Tax=Baudoinia panamericana (strain UAMH 10762) TaxID=717646 RepID=M2MH59_BAUPA|nr:uncharacterized protein BAUCODRAFT_510329 [Baudoinia panamericana UAMH 10762]EMC95951.1 hypothetical protein BAUCODRAFT_510329 [Baudoinia panamericana UAMH 10762]